MLHIIYRSYGGENLKGRPSFYSKALALASFVRAVEVARAAGVELEVVYSNDGPVPAELLAIMERSGEVVARVNVGNKPAFRQALELPVERRWPDRDLVWLAEDDYLYLPESLITLAAAPAAFPKADYFALYASIGDRPPPGGSQPEFAQVPSGWHGSPPVEVRGSFWQRGLSTTGTFGGRVQALREDRWIFELALRSGSAWDHTMSLLYQGLQPFPWAWLAGEVSRARAKGPREVARKAGFGALRSVLNVGVALRTRLLGARARRELVTTDPAVITHIEAGHLAAGTDWEQVALDCARWAEGRGISVKLAGFGATSAA